LTYKREFNLPSKLAHIQARHFPSTDRNSTESSNAMASLGGNHPFQHPLEATASAIGAAGGDPRGNRASHFMSANEGPAEIAAKITGLSLGGKREDDSAYFTNNEAIPWPDP